jgi:MFS family permease
VVWSGEDLPGTAPGSPALTAYGGRRPTAPVVVVLAQLLLRVGSAAGGLLVGSYFAQLRAGGVAVTSALLGVLAGLGFLTELVVAPLAGALSDRYGRRRFVIVAPVLAAAGVVLLPGASLLAAVPPLGLVVLVVGVSRLVEGSGSAMAVPATLGLLADATEDDRQRRGRLMSFFELSSSGGIALGAAAGPLLWADAGLWSFPAIAAAYLAGAALVATFVPAGTTPYPDRRQRVRQPWRRWRVVFSDPRLARFLPAWVTANAILGTWITGQITFVLAGGRRVPGQRFVGAFYHHEPRLSLLLAGYVLVFAACTVGWAFLVGRLPTRPVLAAALAGVALAATALIGLNRGGPPLLLAPLVVVGMFLLAGFAPAALTYLADTSAAFATDRGLIMGVYSVVLGTGNLAGNLLGGVFAQWGAFDGLALQTIILAAVGLVSVAVLPAQARSGTPAAAQRR